MKYNFTGAFQNYMDIDKFTLKWMVHDLDPPPFHITKSRCFVPLTINDTSNMYNIKNFGVMVGRNLY